MFGLPTQRSFQKQIAQSKLSPKWRKMAELGRPGPIKNVCADPNGIIL
jgi:hypothetical protein